MKGPQVVLLIVLGAAFAFAVLAAVVAGVRYGWVQGQASIKIVPPWQRRAPEKREAKTAPEPAPAAVPIDRKAAAS